jgi:SAM-dependent methyltransferase
MLHNSMVGSENKLVTAFDIMRFGWGLGFRSFFKGDYRIALKRLILPVNYWRATIFSQVGSFLTQVIDAGETGLRILDVGSPKLLALYLAAKMDCNVYATDLQDRAIHEEWQRHYKNIGKKDNMLFEFADAKSLSYPNEYFDIVYSLSVIHMITPAENGDIIALEELQKKLRPGGYLILEIPFREQYRVNYSHTSNFEERYEGQPLFKERQYDKAAVETRISHNVAGDLVKRLVLRERLPFDRILNSIDKTITLFIAFIEPWLDLLNITEAKNEHEELTGKSIILFYKMRK